MISLKSIHPPLSTYFFTGSTEQVDDFVGELTLQKPFNKCVVGDPNASLVSLESINPQNRELILYYSFESNYVHASNGDAGRRKGTRSCETTTGTR